LAAILTDLTAVMAAASTRPPNNTLLAEARQPLERT
jgi:hypothetical protein